MYFTKVLIIIILTFIVTVSGMSQVRIYKLKTRINPPTPKIIQPIIKPVIIEKKSNLNVESYPNTSFKNNLQSDDVSDLLILNKVELDYDYFKSIIAPESEKEVKTIEYEINDVIGNRKPNSKQILIHNPLGVDLQIHFFTCSNLLSKKTSPNSNNTENTLTSFFSSTSQITDYDIILKKNRSGFIDLPCPESEIIIDLKITINGITVLQSKKYKQINGGSIYCVKTNKSNREIIFYQLIPEDKN